MSLNGWKVKDTSGHAYTFRNYTLGGGGAKVKVHTGHGTNSATDRYWGQSGYIWNNDGDKATLKDAGGGVDDSCSYSGSGSKVNC